MRLSKPAIGAIALVVTIAAVIGAVWLKGLYDQQYVLDEYYYAVIPAGFDYTPEEVFDDAGVAQGYCTVYRLTCYNAEGEAKELEFIAYLSFQELYPPGTYVRVSVSKSTVLGQNALDRSDVPGSALTRLEDAYRPSSAASLEEYALEQTGYLGARSTPSSTAECSADGTSLVYTYTYSADAEGLAMAALEPLDHVYRAQFRADQDACPELEAIYLEVKLGDGRVIFSQKYDRRVTFGYDSE